MVYLMGYKERMIELRQTEVLPDGLMACVIGKFVRVSMFVFDDCRSVISAMRSRLVRVFWKLAREL